jgi:hypothetical protein
MTTSLPPRCDAVTVYGRCQADAAYSLTVVCDCGATRDPNYCRAHHSHVEWAICPACDRATQRVTEQSRLP